MELELRQLSDGSLELRMQAESPQARDLLLAQSAELRDKLQGQGMSLSHFSCTSDGQREAAQRQEPGSSQALAGQSIQSPDEEPSLDTQQTAVSAMGLHLYA
jgi:flagellar hook-length control protein FliK